MSNFKLNPGIGFIAPELHDLHDLSDRIIIEGNMSRNIFVNGEKLHICLFTNHELCLMESAIVHLKKRMAADSDDCDNIVERERKKVAIFPTQEQKDWLKKMVWELLAVDDDTPYQSGRSAGVTQAIDVLGSYGYLSKIDIIEDECPTCGDSDCQKPLGCQTGDGN